MNTVEHIEATLSAGRKMPTYRVNLNPQNYKWRIVCGANDIPALEREWETREEAEAAMMRISK